MSQSELSKLASERRERLLRNRRQTLGALGVVAVMAKLSPSLAEPTHLRPYTERLDQAIEQETELCFHAPPQHGKTECAKHAFVSWACRAPGKRHAYATYNDDRALSVMKGVRRLCFEAGLDPHSRKGELVLSGGTEIRFVGRGGGLTGNPIDGVLVCDDLMKDRKEAESTTIRESAWDWVKDVAFTRRHPGSSVINMATRWHADDPSGRFIKDGYEYIRLAAVCDSDDDPLGRVEGEPLWDQRPLEFLQKFMVNVYTWASLYQGRPRPRGDSLFKDPVFYTRLPAYAPSRIGYGADLAYTERTRSDHSVLLQGRLYGTDLYLTGMLRAQVQAPEFTKKMAVVVNGRKGPVRWLCSGTEKGVAHFIQKSIPSFSYRVATADKYVRATPFADIFWNVGRCLVPENSTWADEFVAEMCSFTGVKDPADDQVDAAAALGDLMKNFALKHESLKTGRPEGDRVVPTSPQTLRFNRERSIG